MFEFTNEKSSLLFCDTFAHGGQEEYQLDMVGFSQVVSVCEVRVIPNGCKVHPEITDRLGETRPTSFTLDLFVKDLGKPNASVFDKLGMLEYEEGKSIQFVANTKIATNILLLKGWYQNLTICIYGKVVNFKLDAHANLPASQMEVNENIRLSIDPMLISHPSIRHPIQATSASIPHVVQASTGPIHPGLGPVFIRTQPVTALPPHMEQVGFNRGNFPGQSPQDDERYHEQDDYHRGRGGHDFRHRNRDVNDRDLQYNQYPRDNSSRFEEERRMYSNQQYFNQDNQEHKNQGSRATKNNQLEQAIPSEELFEPLSPEPDFRDDSQESRKTQRNSNEQIGYEDIESDEDMMLEDFDFDDVNLQGDFESDETWESLALNYNPYQSSLTSIETFNNITETPFEQQVKKLKSSTNIQEPSQLKQLQNYIVSDSEADRDAKWVLMLEDLPNIFPPAMVYLRSQVSQKIKEKHFVSIITEWAAYGLNMDNIRAQPLAINMRFLKASLKLTCLLANSCGEYLRLLVEGGVQKKLVELLKMEHVASSIKLLVIRALDATTNSAFGMESFLHWNAQKEDEESFYEQLVSFWLTNPTVRVVMAIKSLLEKVNFYESLSTMQSICSKIAESPAKEELVVNDIKEEERDEEEEEQKTTKKSVDLNISMKDVNALHSTLFHMFKLLQSTDKISQPTAVTFPISSKMKDKIIETENYPVVMRLLQSRRFLESLTMIVTSPLFCEPIIYALVRDILFLLMDFEEGLLFLSLDIITTNNLIRALLQVPCENDVDYTYMLSLTQFKSNEESRENCYAHHIGLLLIYHLQALQYVYQLQKSTKYDATLAEMDNTENIATLHSLYAMSFAPVGCDAVVNILAKSNHINALLPFLIGNEEFVSKLKKSVSSRYAATLLNLTLRQSHNVEFYKTFGEKLLGIPKQVADHDTVYDEVHSYLFPLEKVKVFDMKAIPIILETIKTESDDFKFGSPLLNGVLVALRLLKSLVKTKDKLKGSSKDLEQNVAVITMISSNGLDIFLQLCSKISDHLEASIKQSNPIVSPQCSLLLQMLSILLELTDVVLTHLLATTFCFKDSRLVQRLLKLHALLCSKPTNSFMEATLLQIQDAIVDLLIKFLKGTTSTPDSEEAVKASTSYILLKEVMTFTVEKPEHFVSGLMLLSEFLPTPLPVYTFYELKENEVKKVMSDHMLAMANISFLGEELQFLLKTVIASSSSNLQYYLRRVACQLVDLSASISGLLIRSLLRLISTDLDTAFQEQEDSNSHNSEVTETASKKRLLSNVSTNAFSLLSYLVCQPAGKVTLLNILAPQEDGNPEFPDFINRLISVAENEQNLRFMDGSLLPFFQSLCDHEICMGSFDGLIHLLHLSNSLPDEKLLKTIAEMLFSLLSKSSIAIPIIIRSLNILESLTDHDYGMKIISDCLIENGDCVDVFLNRMVEEVEKKSQSQLVYAAISTFVEFISLTNSTGPETYMKPYLYDEDVKTEEKDQSENTQKSESSSTPVKETQPLQRSIFINGNVLKQIFKLDDKNSNTHPLTKLEKLIEEEGKSDEELVSISQAITTLRMIMIASTSIDQTKETTSPMKLLPVDSVQNQFNKRLTSVLMNGIDDERASSNDWFDELPPEDIDSDSETDTVKVNLIEMCEKYFPNFNLKEEMEKGVVDTAMMKKSKRHKHAAFFKAGEHIEDTKRLRFDASALSTPPSLRGIGRGANRGATRGYMNRGSGRGGRGFNRGFNRGRGRGRGGPSDMDGFRQRRQNTSRPPSMHVDDFISMEKKGDTLMSHPKNDNANESSMSGDRHDNGGSFNSPGSNPRWSYPHFRRNNDDSQSMGGSDRNNYNNYNNSRNYYNSGGGGGSRFHNRSSSDWNNSNYRPRGNRDSYVRRGSNMGGYWNKNRDDNRYSGGGGYRQGNRMNYRHSRTFTR